MSSIYVYILRSKNTLFFHTTERWQEVKALPWVTKALCRRSFITREDGDTKSWSSPGFLPSFLHLLGSWNFKYSAKVKAPYPAFPWRKYLRASPSPDCTQITDTLCSWDAFSTVLTVLAKVLLNFKICWLFFLITVRRYKLIIYLCTIKFASILYVLCSSYWLDSICPEFREASVCLFT